MHSLCSVDTHRQKLDQIKRPMYGRHTKYSILVAVILCMLLAMEFSVTYCQVSISLSLAEGAAGSLCRSFIVLQCSFSNVHFVRIEEFLLNSNRFSPLTTTYISRNPDFEEEASDGIYTLSIAADDRYNATRYRCRGFGADLSEVIYSNEWTVIVPAAEVCEDMETNDTDTVNSNNSIVNNTAPGSHDGQNSTITDMNLHHDSGLLALLSITAVLPIIVLTMTALSVVAVAQRRHKTGSVSLHDEAKLPPPVQADARGLRAKSESPVMPGVRVSETSISLTHFVTRFHDGSSTFEVKAWPNDMLQHPEHPRTVHVTDNPFSSVCREAVSGSHLHHTELSSGYLQERAHGDSHGADNCLPVAEAAKLSGWNTAVMNTTRQDDRDAILQHQDKSSAAMLSSRIQMESGAHAGSSVSVPENLRSPQVASDDDDSNVAVHVAGDVIQYGMVRFQLDHSHHHGDVQRHIVGSRSGHEGDAVDSVSVPMLDNPAYVALESVH